MFISPFYCFLFLLDNALGIISWMVCRSRSSSTVVQPTIIVWLLACRIYFSPRLNNCKRIKGNYSGRCGVLCSISSRDFFHENRGHMWSNRHNFQPEAPHLVCTITSYNVCRSIIIHRSLCHGGLHNAVFCAIRHIEYRSHVLYQHVSWRLCSAARPFGQDREFPRHPNILLSRIGEELSWVPHLIGHSDTVFTPC